MSFLSSINVGFNKRRDVHNLSGHTHSTTELGYFQPTFCRYIVPDSKIKINSRSICRLSPVAVPTIGQVSLRSYFYYVDISTLWTPFDALRKGTNYRYGDGTVSQPLCVPTFRLCDFLKDAFKVDNSFNRSSFIRNFRESIVCTVYKGGTPVTSASTAFTDVLANNPQQLLWIPYCVRQTANGDVKYKSSETSSAVSFNGNGNYLNDKLPLVKNSNADFAFYIQGATDNYHVLGKFTGLSKRVRKQFIGCGYSFNPFDTSRQTLLKLFAVYKAWFDTMAVQRTINFNNTECYQAIKYLSENPPTYGFDSNLGKYTASVYQGSYNSSIDEVVTTFICKLGDICYNLPPDYFSASDKTSYRGVANISNQPVTGIELNSIDNLNIGYSNTHSDARGTISSLDARTQTTVAGTTSSRAMELAQALLKWTNKRSVVGKKISELLALDGEKDIHNNEHENVHHLGVDRLDIDISPIFSQSSTQDANLGDYAAIGYGQGASDRFVYDSKVYGILLCLTAVVPTSGYFQGILHENGDSSMFDFFAKDFDALGYQGLFMNELISDLQFQTAAGANSIGTDLGFMGVVPRYQHLKVGRNICNGDMSVPSLQPVMLPYTLDRHFITCIPKGNADDFEDVSVPAIDPETFRQIKANDAYGDYNRIFQYVGSDFDHFILHLNFDCKVVSPMLSVANSYDTFQDEDREALKFEHE